MWGDLHEMKEVDVTLPREYSAGEGNRLFRELGATLHYDVYSFNASTYEKWQAESLIYIYLFCKGEKVDAQDNFDEIKAKYPFATRPSNDQSSALALIGNIVKMFSGTATYQGRAYYEKDVQKDWDNCNDYLLKEWGEEPGSESLRIMIEENNA